MLVLEHTDLRVEDPATLLRDRQLDAQGAASEQRSKNFEGPTTKGMAEDFVELASHRLVADGGQLSARPYRCGIFRSQLRRTDQPNLSTTQRERSDLSSDEREKSRAEIPSCTAI